MRVGLFLVWLTLMACSQAGGATQTNESPKPIRVALMTFTTDDNSYRSSLAAQDLATVLQADLSADPGFQWVERAELKAAERELELSELGMPDAVGALRRGKFVAAEWIVDGRFTASNEGPWELTVEVVDVARADLLAQRRATIPRLTHPTLKSALPQSERVASVIRAALQGAAERWRTIAGRRTVALLSLIDAADIETNLVHALEASTNVSRPLRVVQVRRAGQSMLETEMILLGMVEQDPAAWERLADVYVWGRFMRRELRKPNSRGIPFPYIQPTLELMIWDGRGEPQPLSIDAEQDGGRDVVLAQLTPGAVMALTRAAEHRRDTNVSLTARTRVAQALVEQAKTFRGASGRWPRPMGSVDAQSDADALQQIRLLETACFFDPQNQPANELLLRLVWRNGMESCAPNWFWFLYKRSEGWGRYVERFGFASGELPPLHQIGPIIDTAPVVENYFVSALRLMDVARLGNKEQFGFLRDMSGHVARKWLAGFTTELARRIVKTADQPVVRSRAGYILLDGLTGNPKPLTMVELKLRHQCLIALWPAFIEGCRPGSRREEFRELCDSVKAIYAEMGLAGQEGALLEQLNKPKLRDDQTPVRLPRAADLDRPRPPFLNPPR